MVRVVKCIQRYYDKSGKITGYVIQDKQGNLDILWPDIVKDYLTHKDSVPQSRYDFVNLALTSDNKIHLIKDKISSPYCYIESYIIHSLASKIKDINQKALIFRSNIDPKLHLAKYKLLNAPLVEYKFYDDYLYLQTQQVVEFVSAKQIRFRNSNLRENMRIKAVGFFAGLNFRTIDISQVDTVEMTDMSAMFEYCTTNRVNLSTINTSNVTDMSCMFYGFGTPDTVLNLTRFNTSKVKYFYCMFAEYKGKHSLDLSMFDTRQGKDFYGMCLRCQATSINIRGFDFSNATDTDDMFERGNSRILQ